MMRRAALLLLCAAGAAGLSAAVRAQTSAATPSLTATQTAAIDRIGRLSVAGKAAPGVTIAVIRDGSVVYDKGFGYRDVEDRVPAGADTRYPIGSNTKQFTSTAILMLQDEGKLNVSAPLSTYLPEIPHARQVTIRDLLTHAGGYAEFTALGDFDELGNRPASNAQIVAHVDARPLAFAPGTKREYSNTGYVLLTMVIERLSKMSYKDFLQKKIFGPLGMTSTYVRDSDDTSPNVATEYDSFSLGPWEHALHIDYTWFSGAGSIISNARDLEKWNAALAGGKLLSKRSQKEMMTPINLGNSFPGYAFGIIVSKLPNGHRMISHGGNTTGAATQDARFPDDHLAIEVLANSGAFDYNAAVSAIYGAFVHLPKPRASAKPRAAAAAKPFPGSNPQTIAAAKRWLDRAVAGEVDLGKLRPDFRARMSVEHQASLRALAALGPRTYKLVDFDRRPPSSGYIFTVTTPKKMLLYAYDQDDAGTVAGADVIVTVYYAPTGAA